VKDVGGPDVSGVDDELRFAEGTHRLRAQPPVRVRDNTHHQLHPGSVRGMQVPKTGIAGSQFFFETFRPNAGIIMSFFLLGEKPCVADLS
jgi:hypothetical protein